MFAGAVAIAVSGVMVAVGVPAGVIAAGVRVGAIASRLDADRGKAPARLNASISFFLESLNGRPGAGAGHRRLNLIDDLNITRSYGYRRHPLLCPLKAPPRRPWTISRRRSPSGEVARTGTCSALWFAAPIQAAGVAACPRAAWWDVNAAWWGGGGRWREWCRTARNWLSRGAAARAA
jgi:hypothetical protein